MDTNVHRTTTSSIGLCTKRLLLTGVILGTMLVFTPPAAADPLPGCAVTAGNPAVTVVGLAASGFSTGHIGCTDPNPMLVIGAVISAVPGTKMGNGDFCVDCGGHSVEAGPAMALDLAHCFVGKASGSAVGVGVVNPPFDVSDAYCQVLNVDQPLRPSPQSDSLKPSPQ